MVSGDLGSGARRIRAADSREGRIKGTSDVIDATAGTGGYNIVNGLRNREVTHTPIVSLLPRLVIRDSGTKPLHHGYKRVLRQPCRSTGTHHGKAVVRQGLVPVSLLKPGYRARLV